MNSKIWNFWANKYSKLWVQKYSLRPTRNYIINSISKIKYNEDLNVLDLGCGPGELIEELSNKFDNFHITGLDFSEKMLEISRLKNRKANHILMDVTDLNKLNNKFKIIICTHSFPYYREPVEVLKKLYRLLEDDGRIFMGFASGDSFYDKFVLSFVKLTTGRANYPSHGEFNQMVHGIFTVENYKIIKEKLYMPRIAVYTLRKVRK
ncbi:MAG: class I SAM-dependent methyltransferase [Tissierellia bacterium]|nr:class I SAM-dependent methyltransferase [Tissierellia bacterium]MDD4780885.1 class I SAM-dependent methyltransferase [Tissierellia bacterium]